MNKKIKKLYFFFIKLLVQFLILESKKKTKNLIYKQIKMSNQALTLANLRENFKKKLNEDTSFNNLLAKVETKTKVNREFIAYGKYISL